MIASVAIGIGIDYTIHFLSAFLHFKAENLQFEELMEKAILGTGKAIIFNAASVAAGFLVLVGSNFIPLNYFGMMVAVTMATASFAALTLMPVILEIFKPKFIDKTNRRKK